MREARQTKSQCQTLNLPEKSFVDLFLKPILCLVLEATKWDSKYFEVRYLEVCNHPMTPHINLLVGWSVSRAVGLLFVLSVIFSKRPGIYTPMLPAELKSDDPDDGERRSNVMISD